MSKKSVVPGASISSLHAEVTNVGAQGVWMLIDGLEHFLDYENFPGSGTARLLKSFMLKDLKRGTYGGQSWMSI